MAVLLRKTLRILSRTEDQGLILPVKILSSSRCKNISFFSAHSLGKQTKVLSRVNPDHMLERCFSRISKSWFRLKKRTFDVVDLHEVSGRKSVPDYILKPDYAETGVPNEPDTIQVMNETEVNRMRQSCALAKVILEEVGRNIQVSIKNHLSFDDVKKVDLHLFFEV